MSTPRFRPHPDGDFSWGRCKLLPHLIHGLKSNPFVFFFSSSVFVALLLIKWSCLDLRALYYSFVSGVLLQVCFTWFALLGFCLICLLVCYGWCWSGPYGFGDLNSLIWEGPELKDLVTSLDDRLMNHMLTIRNSRTDGLILCPQVNDIIIHHFLLWWEFHVCWINFSIVSSFLGHPWICGKWF